MAKRGFQISPAEEQVIQQILETCGDDPTCNRLQAVLWYASGKTSAEITASLGCSRSSLMSWCQAYRMAGVKGLMNRRLGGNNARLNAAQLEELSRRIQTSKPRDIFKTRTATPDGEAWTIQDLYRAVRMWYGVVYRSRSSYYNLLERVKSKAQVVESS